MTSQTFPSNVTGAISKLDELSRIRQTGLVPFHVRTPIEKIARYVYDIVKEGKQTENLPELIQSLRQLGGNIASYTSVLANFIEAVNRYTPDTSLPDFPDDLICRLISADSLAEQNPHEKELFQALAIILLKDCKLYLSIIIDYSLERANQMIRDLNTLPTHQQSQARLRSAHIGTIIHLFASGCEQVS